MSFEQGLRIEHMVSARFSNDARIVLHPSQSNLSEPARRGTGRQYARVVDSVSCRQMYLRSYTFMRKESVPEETKKYIHEVKKVFGFRTRRVWAKYDEVPCSTLFSAVRRILTCTARIKVADLEVHRYF